MKNQISLIPEILSGDTKPLAKYRADSVSALFCREIPEFKYAFDAGLNRFDSGNTAGVIEFANDWIGALNDGTAPDGTYPDRVTAWTKLVRPTTVHQTDSHGPRLPQFMTLCDETVNRDAIAFDKFRSEQFRRADGCLEDANRPWFDARRGKSDLELFKEFAKTRPDLRKIREAEELAAREAEEKAEVEAIAERLRRAAKFRELLGPDACAELRRWVRKNASRIPDDSTAAEIEAVHAAEMAGE